MKIEDPYFHYIIVFHLNSSSSYSPIIHERTEKENMHLLEPAMIDILPALEFIMHLPRHSYDYFNIDEDFMDSQYDTPHMIYPVPDCILNDFLQKFPYHPSMFIISDTCSEEVVSLCNKFDCAVPLFMMKNLRENNIVYYWNMLQPAEDEGFERLDISVNQFLMEQSKLIALPGLFSSKQFDDVVEYCSIVFNSQNLESDVVIKQWEYKCRNKALIYMKKHYSKKDYDNKLKFKKAYFESCQEVRKSFDLSAIITAHGVAKEQIRYGISLANPTADELRAIRILGVHKAISRNGYMVELGRIPLEAFSLLANIEQSCIDGTNNKHIWKSLKKLGKQLAALFSREQVEYIKRAKDITAFSDFPIGLAIFEGDELPLQCYKAISYRPLSPLTRQLQIEMKKTSEYYLGKGKKIKVLFIECIINNDKNRLVYNFSETVYDVIRTKFGNDDFQISYCQAYDIDTIVDTIGRNLDADILYISAHGHYDKRTNCAGIMVGEEFWMGDQDLRVPPLVILSACHTSPRGIGAVSIADMFIRNGAIAVLSTFIPVNARRNMILMTRLFTYISEAQKGSQQYKTISELWNGLVITNAIFEILDESPKLNFWMHENNKKGIPRIIDFQLNKSVGRLRNISPYSDTITMIKEMLKEEGLDGKFSSILDNYDYFPESFFYQFIGSPENIFLYNEIFQESIEKGLANISLT